MGSQDLGVGCGGGSGLDHGFLVGQPHETRYWRKRKIGIDDDHVGVVGEIHVVAVAFAGIVAIDVVVDLQFASVVRSSRTQRPKI